MKLAKLKELGLDPYGAAFETTTTRGNSYSLNLDGTSILLDAGMHPKEDGLNALICPNRKFGFLVVFIQGLQVSVTNNFRIAAQLPVCST